MIFPIFYRKRLESIHDLILRPGGHGGIHKDACDDLVDPGLRAKKWLPSGYIHRKSPFLKEKHKQFAMENHHAINR